MGEVLAKKPPSLPPPLACDSTFLESVTHGRDDTRPPLSARPVGCAGEAAKALFEKSAPNYQGAPGLVRKYYLFGEDRTGGGVYLWESREAAERMYSDAWRKMITERYGNAPEITYYETPVIVDNASRRAAAA